MPTTDEFTEMVDEAVEQAARRVERTLRLYHCTFCTFRHPLRSAFLLTPQGDLVCPLCNRERGFREPLEPPPPQGDILIVNRYNYHGPTDVLQKQKGETGFTYGWELELALPHSRDGSCRQFLADFSKKYNNCIYLKWDGSILRGLSEAQRNKAETHTSFEIVTRPFTWGWWKDHEENFLEMLQALTKEYRAESFPLETCGLHVHVGNMNHTHRKRFMRVLQDITNLNILVSRRHSTGYCSFNQFDNTQIGRFTHEDRRGAMGHYHAVRYTQYGTMEARFLRGTLHPRTFQGLLEYIKGIATFVRDLQRLPPNREEAVLNYFRGCKDKLPKAHFLLDRLELL
jgi:hypothetical protein